jgi:hypothetical protein
MEFDDHDDDDDDDDMDPGEYLDWEPAPEYWGEVGLSDDESLSGGDLEGGSSEGAWSSDEADHERPFFDAMQEVQEEDGIAHIEPVEEEEGEAHEPYHSDSASGNDSELHGHPISDDEEGYEDSFIDDEEEEGAAGYNTQRTRQHRQNRVHSVIDLDDSEDESEGRHSDLIDTDEESLDARTMARQLGRGMRLGGGGVDYDTDVEEPFRGPRQSPINIDDNDDDDDGEDCVDNPARGNYGHRIYADDDDDDDEEEDEEDVRPRRTGLRRRLYHFVDDEDSDS